jgi:hypothetical protein
MINLSTQSFRSKAKLLSSEKTEKEFGKIYLLKDAQSQYVEMTIWDQDNSEGWQTGIALDSSISMKISYGKGLKYLKPMPDDVNKLYAQQKLTTIKIQDGREYIFFTQEGVKIAKEQGYLAVSDNEVEPVAKDFIKHLNDELESGSGSYLIYWACGTNGDQIQKVGHLSESNLDQTRITGANEMGNQTHLLPALKFFLDHFRDVKKLLLIFITDGQIDDLDGVKQFTIDLAKKIEAKTMPLIKAILIGVGDKISEQQMEELDDLDTGTDIDIWDHKIAKSMRDLSEISVELVNQDKILASSAIIYDDQNHVVHRFLDGLPVVSRFTLPLNAKYFVLEVMGKKIKQHLL